MSLTDELIQYCEDVENDVIPACKKHKWACQRFIRDLKRQGTKVFPYVFDEEKAGKYLKWMTFFKHTKGPLEGQFINPHPIQKFVYGNIYGWVHKDTGLRRFRIAYWQVARKNAKSQGKAILGLYEMSAFGESCAEVYVAATKKDQTRHVWGEADLIYRRCQWLKGKFKTSYGVIQHPKSGSTFARMSKEDRQKGDGSNPQCGILDEYHAHETTEYYDVLTSGMKTRKQPLLFIITTAGFELNHPCYVDEYEFVSKLLDPDQDIENERYFAMVNELDMDMDGNLLDDITDERVWLKPNPIIGDSEEGKESIRAELELAQGKPEKMRDFLTKTMNVWVNQRAAGYMDMAKWKSCGVSKTNLMPDFRGLQATMGFDLSAAIDLTSVGFEIELPDGRSLILSHSFIPEETLFAKMKTDKVPYMRWVKEGWITMTPGAAVDYRFMVKWTEDFTEKHQLVMGDLCFDRYMATMVENEYMDLGRSVVEVPQGIPTLSQPTKDFREKVYNKQIIHVNNPVLNWAMGNAVIRTDHNGNIMLDKGKAIQRIDPVASVINAHVGVCKKAPTVASVYEDREILTF